MATKQIRYEPALLHIFFNSLAKIVNYSFLVTKIQEYNYFQGHPATAISETTWSQVFCIFTSTLKKLSLVASYRVILTERVHPSRKFVDTHRQSSSDTILYLSAADTGAAEVR